MKLLSATLKETPHFVSTFCFHDASLDFCFRVKSLWSEAGITSFLVGRTIYDCAHLCPSDRSSAHHARLYCDIQRAVCEILAAQSVGRRRNGQHLGMGRHVVKGFRLIVRTCNYHTVAHNNRANGYLTLIICRRGLGKRQPHKPLVAVCLFVYHTADLFDS